MIVFCVILTLACSLRACHMWLTRNHMSISEIWGEFTLFICWNFEICKISKFQRSELGRFIPNFPLNHVTTSTNIHSILMKTFFVNSLRKVRAIRQPWTPARRYSFTKPTWLTYDLYSQHGQIGTHSGNFTFKNVYWFRIFNVVRN